MPDLEQRILVLLGKGVVGDEGTWVEEDLISLEDETVELSQKANQRLVLR